MARHRSIKKRLRNLESRLGGSAHDGDFVDPETLTPGQRHFYDAFIAAFEELPEDSQDLVDEALEFHVRHGNSDFFPTEAHEQAYAHLMELTAVHWDALYEARMT